MYEVNEKVYNHLLQEMKEELDKREYRWNEHALRDILNQWKAQKAPLLELLSKHPNWDEDGLMIRFDVDFSREIDKIQSQRFITWLKAHTDIQSKTIVLKDAFGTPTWTYHLDVIFNAAFAFNTYIPEEEGPTMEAINELSDTFHFRAGMKTTKVVRKICEYFGWDKVKGIAIDIEGNQIEYNAFEREYAKFCDALCPIKVTRHTCISLNPIDFLLMSYGNSWNSCHYIGSSPSHAGCYSSGTISYMLDEHSFVFYTVSADYDDKEIEREPKLQRQMFGYHDNQLLQSRLYPQGNDCGAKQTYDDIRQIVQKVIADCCGKPNLWVKRSVKNVSAGGTIYPDWEHFDYLCSVSVFRDAMVLAAANELECIEMGEEPICIRCGYTHGVEDNISCCDSRWTCSCCGAEIDDEDDVYYIRDEPYCCDCAVYCDLCGEYELSEYTTYIESEGINVCNDCRDDYFTWCGCCDEYVRNDDVTYVERDGFYVCNECLEYHYHQCEKCEEYVHDDDVNDVVDDETGEIHFYCNDCLREIEEEMEDEEEEEAV